MLSPGIPEVGVSNGECPDGFRVKVHAVAKHLNVIDFHITQVPRWGQ